MKKALWWILGILLSPVVLFLLLTALLYFPPFQNWAVDKVAAIASEKTGMEISVDHVDLSFPLDLGIDGFRIVQQPDTIADVERMVVDVQLLPLLKQKVIINELEVNDAKFNTAQFVDAARVKGQFKRLALSSRGIDLDQQTVEENLRLGAYLRKDKGAIAADMEEVYQLFPRLKERLIQPAGTLSGGEQQMLAMGRALMAKPSILLLDEPSMGLSPLLVSEIFHIIQEINDKGTTILLVEQNAKRALAIADRAYVLETGKITLEGTGEELANDERVQKAYLGG